MGDCAPTPVRQNPEIKKLQTAVTQMTIEQVKSRRNKGKKAMTENDLYQLLCQYFDIFDQDHDDALSFEQVIKMLKQIQTSINKKRNNSDKIELDMRDTCQFFRKMDINGDGLISKEEFYRFYKSL